MSILKKLFKAADQHGEDAGALDHTVGDLQDLLHRSWATHFQTMKLIAELDRDAATDLLDECYGVGCRDEQDLDALRAEVLEGYRSGKISSAAIQALG